MKLGSGGYISGNSGLCAGPLWGGMRFLELPDRETLGPVPTKASVPTITPAHTPATTLSTLTERPEPVPEQTGVIPTENEHSVPFITTSASLIQDWTLPPQSVQDFVNRSQAIVIGTVTAISEPVVERPYNSNPADFAELPESQWPSTEVAYWTIEIEQMLLDDGNIEAKPKVRMEPNPPHRTDKPLPQLNPNPPKDTDGPREDNGRGGRELQGRWPGLHWDRWEVGGRSSVAGQGPYGRLRELRCAEWRENTQQGTPADRGGASLWGHWVSCRQAFRPGVEWLATGPGRD